MLFAKTHEWASIVEENGARVATIGISAFAIESLTDLVFIELPKVGAQVESQQPFCEVESVKAVSDVYAPVSGEVVEANESLPDNLETLSTDPYGAGWIAKIRLDPAADASELMDYDAYQKQCSEQA
ncbi:MAG: glycine cleavage system protein GcvH [Planctomycetales bacterium]|nr:glycine cleavage system protein GcvH [Planctomycetales bacterium]